MENSSGWKYRTSINEIESGSAAIVLTHLNDLCQKRFGKTWCEKLQTDPVWISFKKSAAEENNEVWYWDDCIDNSGTRGFVVRNKNGDVVAGYNITIY